jgi:hypothetical protein
MDNFTILLMLYILILGFCAFLIYKFFEFKSKVNSLTNENSKLKSKMVGFKNYLPGRKGLVYNFGLQTQSDPKTTFNVTYEVEIIEVSESRVKVSAYDLTSSDSFALDPKNKPSIIAFYQNQWVSKEVVELFMDKSDIRDNKIEQILS